MSHGKRRHRLRLRLKRTQGGPGFALQLLTAFSLVMASVIGFGGSAAQANQGGDNGSVKTHNVGTPADDVNDEPKLACEGFYLDAFGFDGVQQVSWWITEDTHGDTIKSGIITLDDNGHGVSATYTDLSEGMYKLYWTFDGQNGEAKHKVFKIDGCEEPPPPTDVCPNIPGDQAAVPPGMVKDDSGNCVTPPVDVCPNLVGNQPEVPAGMVKDNAGNCVTPPSPPTTDVCPNLAGNQDQVPRGYVLVNGECVIEQPPPDVCPNLSGVQPTVPSGFVKHEGKCVKQQSDAPKPKPKPKCGSGQALVNGECVNTAVAHTGLSEHRMSTWEYALAGLMALLLVPASGLVLKRIRIRR